MTDTPAIIAEDVRRTFGNVVALDGLDLEIGTPNDLVIAIGADEYTHGLVALVRPTHDR